MVVLQRVELVCGGVELLGWLVWGGALWPCGLVYFLVHLVVWCRLRSGFACSVQLGCAQWLTYLMGGHFQLRGEP